MIELFLPPSRQMREMKGEGGGGGVPWLDASSFRISLRRCHSKIKIEIVWRKGGNGKLKEILAYAKLSYLH